MMTSLLLTWGIGVVCGLLLAGLRARGRLAIDYAILGRPADRQGPRQSTCIEFVMPQSGGATHWVYCGHN